MNAVFETVFVIAVLVEVITNFIKNVVPTLEKQYVPLIAGMLGIILAIATETGILAVLDIPARVPVLDYILTGVIVARGANVVHDIAKKLNQK